MAFLLSLLKKETYERITSVQFIQMTIEKTSLALYSVRIHREPFKEFLGGNSNA